MAKMDEDEEFYPPIASADVLEQSIRESVAHWKDLNKQKLREGEAVQQALKEPPALQPIRGPREFSGQRLLNQELAENPQTVMQPGPGYAIIHRGAKPTQPD